MHYISTDSGFMSTLKFLKTLHLSQLAYVCPVVLEFLLSCNILISNTLCIVFYVDDREVCIQIEVLKYFNF
jgi:hypothetical protein